MGLATDYLENVYIEGNTLTFNYKLSEDPYYQWFAIYRGAMPSWDNLKSYADGNSWDWINKYNNTAREGTISYNYSFRQGEIYTLALYKNNEWGLADYHEIIA